MARIPSYTSRSSAITTSGIARARSIPFRDFEGAGMIQLGQQLGKIAESFNEAAENEAVGQATLNATLKLNELQMELQTLDPMEAMSSYDTRAQSILEEASQGLSSNAVARFNSSMRREFASGKIAVQKDGIRRGREKLEAGLVTRLKGLSSAANASDTDVQYKQRADQARQAIDEAIANRVIAADVGERRYYEYLNDADSARASFDMQADPDAFLKNIADKEKEYLSNLTGEQRARFQNQGNEILERRARTAKTKRKAAERDYVKRVDTALLALKSGAPFTKDIESLTSDEAIRANISDSVKAKNYSALVQDAKSFYFDTRQLSKMSVPALLRMQAAYEAEAAEDQGTAFGLQNQNAVQAVEMKKLIDGLINKKQKAAAEKIESALLADQARNLDTPLPDEQQRILSPENIEEVFGNDQSTAAKFIRLVDDQKQFNEIQKVLPSLSRRAEAVVREEMKRQAEDVDQTPEEQKQNLKQLKNFETASATLAKARRDDPVNQALLNNDAVRESTQDLETALQTGDPDQARAAYARHKSILEQYHEDIGTEPDNRRFFSNAMAKREVDNFKFGTLGDASSRIKILREAMGEDWPNAMAELQSKEKLPEVVTQLMVVDDDRLRERMIEVQRNGGFSAIAELLPKPFTNQKFNQEVSRRVRTLSGAADVAGLSMTGAVTKAIGSIAISNMLADRDMTHSQAIDEAYDQVVTQQYDVVNYGRLQGIVTKQDYDSQKTQLFEAGLRHWFSENSNFEFHERNHVRFSQGITDKAKRDIMLQLAQQEGRWQLTPDGQAAELHINGSKAFDVAGRPVRVAIDEAFAIAERAKERNRSRNRRDIR